MASIAILDDKGAELLSTDLSGHGLGRYLRSALSLRSARAIRTALTKPLADGFEERTLAFSADRDVPIGSKNEISLAGGASVALEFHAAGEEIFGKGDLQAPVEVPAGRAYLSLTLEAHLKGGLSEKGTISFGFSGGTAIRYTYFHPFDVVGSQPTLAEGLRALFASAVFPADVEDLGKLVPGAYVSLAGEGKLSFKGQASLSPTANVLATPGLPIVGSLDVIRTASVEAKASFTASGEFEVRASKPSEAHANLAVYRRRGRELTLGAKASLGISADIRGSDPIAMLMRGISGNPEADLLALVNAGLKDDTIETIQRAIAESIDRTLTLSAQFEMSRRSDNEALFAYDIDVPRLDAAAKQAVEDALHGHLSGMDEVVGAGAVKVVTSSSHHLKERKTAWRINLLGFINVASFARLVQEGSLTFDATTGALTAADRVTSERIRVDARPFESDSRKLREVILQSLMVTAAYKSSGALGTSMSLSAAQMYLEQQGRARRADLERYYELLIGLGLCDDGERRERLGSEVDFGSTTFVVENKFDDAACDAMFIDADGTPHSQRHFEQLGRLAFLTLISPADPEDSFRRFALETDATWEAVRDFGSELTLALPSHIRDNALRLARTRGDIVTIIWWASAMHKAATELVVMRKFIAGRSAEKLAADPAFDKARRKLTDALGGVASTTKAFFDDPWDMLAMDAAAARKGRLEAAIVSPRFAARYEDEPPVAAPKAAATRSRAAGVPVAASRGGGAPRPWNDDEVAIFRRHVVNMRNGKLSGSGTFSSTPEQVKEIFEKWIPSFAGQQKAKGLIPRVMFYAHGGLNEEHEGLLPVLRRQRFWEMNGIYPVYFVWETGLFETISDIIGIRTRGARAQITDAAVEAAARRGKIVWQQMKTSAENGAATDGGLTLTAQCAGKLWNGLKGEVEFHALGHSAGSILHAFFLPLVLGQKAQGAPAISVQTLHFLAPAATTDLFKKRLKKLIGPGKPISQLTMYTMKDELEREDRSMRPYYGKSLLYLVRGAFEDKAPMPLLGLQESLNRDLDLIRFFGLAGREKVADMIYSKSADTAGVTERSLSITHGGFDNDVATMTSMVRRVLGVPAAPVVEYFEDAAPGGDEKPPVGLIPESAPATRGRSVAVRGAARKPWTVMVWMAGDNDLEAFGEKDIAELKRIDAIDEANVVVQFDSMKDDNTRRYCLKHGTRVAQDVVASLGETNTGDPAVAVDFFRWGIEQYPAERLLAVIWNHGSGIDDTNVYARGVPIRRRRALFQTTAVASARDRAIAFDDTSQDFLDNLELKRVLAEVKRRTGRVIDVLGFDACLMNMVEVAYQLKGTAKVVVGSEEVEPTDGWPYHQVLGSIASNPKIGAAALAAAITDQYVESYTGKDVTQSALDLAKLDTAAAAIDKLAKALTRAIGTPAEYVAVSKTLNATQRFDTPDYVDVGHLCRELLKRSKASAVKSAASATLEALDGDGGFVIAEQHKGTTVKNASGVAIYFPRGPVSTVYGKLDFAKKTAWGKFLEAYRR